MKLLKIKGFSPFIIIIFLNSLTDVGHKIIIQNTILKVYSGGEMTALMALVNALILLPFILLLSPSGFLSDRFSKYLVIRYSALSSILFAIFITISYYIGNFWLSFFFTFILATQSAILSPSKYGYIKELTGKENLALANGYVQAVTIVAILFSAFLFSLFFEALYNKTSLTADGTIKDIAPLGFFLILFTIIESYFSFKLVKTGEGNRDIKFKIERYIHLKYLKSYLVIVRNREAIWLSIIGLSLFWAIGQVVVATFGAYLKEYADINDTVIIQGIIAVSGIGIVIGSIVAGKISKNYIQLGSVPVATIGITTALFILPFTTSTFYLIILFFIFGFFGGLFIVPLNSLIQFNAKDRELGRVLATNNFIQNVAMLSFLIITMAIAGYGIGSRFILILLAIVALIGAFYTILKLPQSLIEYLVFFVLSRKYKLQVFGLKNIPSDGGVLLLGNHISWIDWAVLQMATPRRIRFVMERSIYERWYLKIFLDFFGVIPISSKGSKHSIEKIAETLDKGEVVALFPEGHISRNGHLGEFYRGFELSLAETKSDVVVIPFYLRGLWGSAFSYASMKLKKSNQIFSSRYVTVSFGEPLSKDIKASLLKQKVYQLSIKSWKDYSQSLDPLHISWLYQAKRDTSALSIVEFPNNRLTNTKILTASILFSKEIKKRSGEEENIGIILPATPISAIINMATLMVGKRVVNLNYTFGVETLLLAIKKADIKSIYTSKKFINKLKVKGFNIIEAFREVKIFFVEEIKEEIKKIDGLITMLKVKIFPPFLLKFLYFKSVKMEDTASIIFSSGSEGEPKGVELTHQNLIGNIKQIVEILNPDEDDVILGSLPIFHSFGFTVTTMLPLIEGIPLATHSDPTDAFGIGKVVARFRVTTIFGTSTFFRLYIKNRKLNPLMFQSVKIAIAGAEKLKDEVKKGFKEKFGLNIYEGYGTTETSPVASVNIPDIINPDTFRIQIGNRDGTVGLPLPGTTFKIVNPDTLEELPIGEEGLILIAGTQIMKGYLKDEKRTEEVIIQKDGIRWYKSGDKGKLDRDGFLTIVDRYSRFAKIGGEMISLGAVEEILFKLFNQEVEFCAVALPDIKKGEKIVALYSGDITLEEIVKRVLNSDMDTIMAPNSYIEVEEIPKLGSGKIDFKRAKRIALENEELEVES